MSDKSRVFVGFDFGADPQAAAVVARIDADGVMTVTHALHGSAAHRKADELGVPYDARATRQFVATLPASIRRRVM